MSREPALTMGSMDRLLAQERERLREAEASVAELAKKLAAAEQARAHLQASVAKISLDVASTKKASKKTPKNGEWTQIDSPELTFIRTAGREERAGKRKGSLFSLDKARKTSKMNLSGGTASESIDCAVIPNDVSLEGEHGLPFHASRSVVKNHMPSLARAEFESLRDDEGRFSPEDEETFRRRVFEGGVDPDLRADVYLYLLGFYGFAESTQERAKGAEEKRKRYEMLKLQWQTIDDVQEGQWAGYKNLKHSIREDVLRTDKDVPFYADSDEGENPNSRAIFEVLLTFGMYNYDMGYCQGMSDLVAPIYSVLRDQATTFWCFCHVMSDWRSNFDQDSRGLQAQLSAVADAVHVLDPCLHAHLEDVGAIDMFFCFGWMRTVFRRAFAFNDILRAWEAVWSQHRPRLTLFLMLGILAQHRQCIIEQDMALDDLFMLTAERITWHVEEDEGDSIDVIGGHSLGQPDEAVYIADALFCALGERSSSGLQAVCDLRPIPKSVLRPNIGEVTSQMLALVPTFIDNIPLGTSTKNLRVYSNVFCGSDAVECLLLQSHIPCATREEATELGCRLLDGNIFKHVNNDRGFEDSSHLYRLQPPDVAWTLPPPRNDMVLNTVYTWPAGVKARHACVVVAELLARFYALVKQAEHSDPRHRLSPERCAELRKSRAVRELVAETAELQVVDLESLNHEERLAFYLNLVALVSIHHAIVVDESGFFQRLGGKQSSYHVGVLGNVTTSFIEHALLRYSLSTPNTLGGAISPKLQPGSPLEPLAVHLAERRVSFVIADGKKTSPKVSVFYPATIYPMLHDATERFLRRAIVLRPEKNVVRLPRVLDVYMQDFAQTKSACLAWCSPYMDDYFLNTLDEMLLRHGKAPHVGFEDEDSSKYYFT